MQTLSLQNIVATGALLLSLVFPWTAAAQTTHQATPYEVLYNVAQPEESTTQPAIEFESGEVVQELPDHSQAWLDGRVSFVGGELTTSERQFQYAQANDIPFVRTAAEGRSHFRSGRLVRLEHRLLNVGARNPYVLPETAAFIYDIAERFYAAGCNRGSERLRINDALRPSRIRLSNSTNYTVHPTGMALDLRVRNLSSRCYNILSSLLHEAESEGQADVTREYYPPHFHVVVIPEERPRLVTLEARYEQPTTPSQSE